MGDEGDEGPGDPKRAERKIGGWFRVKKRELMSYGIGGGIIGAGLLLFFFFGVFFANWPWKTLFFFIVVGGLWIAIAPHIDFGFDDDEQVSDSA